MIPEKESGFSGQAEATLYKKAQGGCQESLNELMARHEGLVRWVAQHQYLLTLPYDEALQAGRQGLWRAILGYDDGRGIRFSTYAYPAIMREIWAAVKGERRRLRREVAPGVLGVTWYRTEPDPAWLREEQEVRESLLALVKRLPKRLRKVIRAYYGLQRKKAPMTLEAIGAQMGVSTERVRQLREEGVVWLSQPAHSQALRRLLGRHNQAQYELADRLAQVWLRRRGGRHGRI
jgi:RNA polymerase sigma factor (sigma-70 family)